MTGLERWKQAQEAEREHESHSSVLGDMSKARSYFRSEFNINISDLKDDRILEVGSGTGMIHTFPDYFETIGIDPLSTHLPVANSPAEVISGVGEQLPFRDESVDRILCFNVLDHVLDPMATLEEMYRVLREGGDLFLTVNVFQVPWPLRRLANHLDPPHPHHFSVQAIQDLVIESGFAICDIHVSPHDVNQWKSVKAFVGTYVFRLRQLHLRATPA